MYQKKKMFVYALTFLLGLGIVAACVFTEDHSYWAGFGGGLAGVGGLRLYYGLKYRRNQEFARKTDEAYQDERNLFLYDKARSVTFVVTAALLGAAVPVLQILHREAYASVCAWIVCGMALIYCAAYWLLSKKY